MKKLLCILMVMSFVAVLGGCAEPKILHCDHCGKEVEVEKSSEMEDSWIIYCEECNEELFGDDPLLNGK